MVGDGGVVGIVPGRLERFRKRGREAAADLKLGMPPMLKPKVAAEGQAGLERAGRRATWSEALLAEKGGRSGGA